MSSAQITRWSCLALVTATSWASLAAGEGTDLAAVRRYVAPNGIAHQAVMLKAAQPLGDVAHDHVILIDTSASQVGEHRQHAIAILESLLTKLPAQDRVRLVAVDVAPMPLTSEFVAPDSEAVSTALEELKSRVPLGVTDLPRAVHSAAGMLPEDRPGSIMYIGDGISTAEIVVAQTVEPLVKQLRNRKIAMHGYGVGPQLNLHLLGVFAHQTGGVVHFDSYANHPKKKADEIVAERADRLAQALSQPVFRPERIEVTNGVTLLPATSLPLRADRETIYLVRGELPADTKINVANSDQTLQWRLTAPVEDPNGAFIAAWTQRVLDDGPISNSLAGKTLLDVAQDDFTGHVTGLVNYGMLALQRRDGDRVQQVIDAVRRLDPQNSELTIVERAAKKAGIKPVASRQVAQAEEESEPAEAPPEPGIEATEPSAAGDLEPRTEPDPDASLLDIEQRAIRIQTQKLRQQVSDTISMVRRLDDPAQGLDEIDRTLNAVRSAIEVEPDVRAQLEKQLTSERLAQINRQDIIERQRIRIQEGMATKEAQARLTEQLQLEEDRLANLIDRVRALMEEGRHGDDGAYIEAEAVSRVANDLRPGDGTTSAAIFGTEAATQLNRSYRLRSRRADQFLETLHQVELSHIPFPDEPPVRFPPAVVWQALTERRRKWANVDLRVESPNENRIRQALEDQTEISFVDISLRDALDFIEDLHGIEIIVLTDEIDQDGGTSDGVVNLELSGVKLRNALYLMLDPMDLIYVIDNEVMKITTENMAMTDPKYRKTRVYPVADLTVPIISGGGMGGGMGGGQGGGMGGGGMGGGGMGGGGMGGGGMGMGGGFSVPPENIAGAMTTQKKNADRRR